MCQKWASYPVKIRSVNESCRPCRVLWVGRCRCLGPHSNSTIRHFDREKESSIQGHILCSPYPSAPSLFHSRLMASAKLDMDFRRLCQAAEILQGFAMNFRNFRKSSKRAYVQVSLTGP